MVDLLLTPSSLALQHGRSSITGHFEGTFWAVQVSRSPFPFRRILELNRLVLRACKGGGGWWRKSISVDTLEGTGGGGGGAGE